MIEVSHLSKSYGSRPAVQDLSFTVPDGQIYGLLGPNGAGKTTLFNCLSAEYPPDSGKVELVTGEGDRLNLKSKLSQYVSLANIFSGGEIPELEIVAYEKEDIDKLLSFMING